MEAIQHRGTPFFIPDCKRRELPYFFEQLGFRVGAEIGVYRGHFTRWFAKLGIKMYAVDPWVKYDGYEHVHQYRLDRYYRQAVDLLAPYDCVVIRKFSMEAVGDFADDSLDFVYIDGNHLFRHVAEDLCEWSKKVRSGGVVSGHDYVETSQWDHVKEVVHAYTRTHGIDNWYVMGREEIVEGEQREQHRSWFWFRP